MRKDQSNWQEYMRDKADDFEIYIENVLEDEPFMIASMMEKITDPRIHACLDTGHAACMSNVPVIEWVQTLSPYIGHLHIHDNNGNYDDHLPLGAGATDMKAVIAAAQELCRDDVTYTLESRTSRPAIDWLRENDFYE